jgi:hypothetical protein
MGIECNGTHWRLVPAEFSVRSKVSPAADAAHVQFFFGNSDGGDVGSVGAHAQAMVHVAKMRRITKMWL